MGAKAKKEIEFTDEVVVAFRKALGSRTVLSIHALAVPDSMAARYLTPIVEEIKQLGPPIEFETAHPHAA